MALRVAPGAEAATLAALRARELVSSAYLERTLPLALEGGGAAQALAYVVDRAHPQYCGTLPAEDQARIIARAAGGRGPNRDYLAATVAALARHKIADPELDALHARVRALGPRPPD
jgi:cation transport protein ChaC